MHATMTKARRIRRSLVAATITALAVALVTAAWLPAGRPDAPTRHRSV